MSEQSCKDCKWWERGVFDEPQGSCHRHAPLVTGGLHNPERTIWPQTHYADICGDWLAASKEPVR